MILGFIDLVGDLMFKMVGFYRRSVIVVDALTDVFNFLLIVFMVGCVDIIVLWYESVDFYWRF